MSPRPDTRPEHLGRALQRTLQHIESGYGDQAHRIWEVWEAAVEDPLRSHCHPQDYRNGTLVLAVSSPSWMQQVQFLTGTVRDTLNRALGEDLVRQVRLRLATTPPPQAPEPPPLPATDQLPPLPREDQQRLVDDLEGISDPQLRAAVGRVRERAARLRLLRGLPEE